MSLLANVSGKLLTCRTVRGKFYFLETPISVFESSNLLCPVNSKVARLNQESCNRYECNFVAKRLLAHNSDI